ncbi:restriction endonuclease subunit S [Actinobaculum sp. 313]|uniref:restriction endonuclease subunit S n=1 Tax=Actinobaculum sp. 313 TaxID=2495645 RepID=UPI000D525B91|nr:restriction endonuclease subunit S [Actinobaculum sp. 313]AWE42087.1 hypothetical protein DDD63_04185 [Actinobaculum sp. 313]
MDSKTLGELCSFSRGASVPRARMYDKGDYLYIHYGELYKGFDLHIDVDRPQVPIPCIRAGERLKAEQRLRDQDIVYVLTSETVDDLGHSFLFNNPRGVPAVAGTETTIVHVERSDLLNPAYLNYLMHSPRFKLRLRQYVKGMKVFRVHPDDLSRIEIPLPTLDVQGKIVSLLDAIFELQMLARRTNDYLAELVRAEFDHRFGEGTPTTDLSDVLTISTMSIAPMEHLGETWELFSIPAFDEKRRPVFERADEIKSNKYVIDNDCILISKLNPSTKRLWLPFCTSTRSVCSTEFIVYKPRRPEHKSFYYAAIDSPRFLEYLLAHITGSTGSRQRVQVKATLSYPMPNPRVESIDEFCEFVDPIIARCQSNEQESTRLEEIRDTLLPKLMSGEIDVSEVQLPTRPNNHLSAD